MKNISPAENEPATTTITVRKVTGDKLRFMKIRQGLKNLDEVISRLLNGQEALK